jgi:Transposase DDE domain group 1
MRKLATRRRRVVIGDDDPTQTAHAGLVLVAELDRVLGIGSVIDEQVGPIKTRRRGLGAGGLVLSVAEMMLAGGDFMCDLDVQRADAAGRELRAVPDIPSSPTFIALAKGFDEGVFGGLEAANGRLAGRWFAALDVERRQALVDVRPTLDLDPTDVEVYGRRKQGVAYNHTGQLVGRPHPVIWAEAGVVIAADLGDGRTDPRPQAPGLIRRATAALPAGLQAPIVRADSGFFDAKVAHAAVAAGGDFGIVAKRSPATWAAARAVPDDAWRPAAGMTGAEVASCGYVPAGWPPGTRCVVRRVRIDAEDISGDGRSRRRRTIDPNQLRLVLDGQTGHAYAYSFICTNLGWLPVTLEWWFRQRALVEERIRDTKLGMALRHLPSGYAAVNRTWMWAALFALNISGWLQTLARTDLTPDGRAHGKRLRRELICLGARILHRGRQLVLRFAPGMRKGPFLRAWKILRALPAYTPAPPTG